MSTRFRLGMPTTPPIQEYDVIVVGAGAAGLTAALYLARYRLNVLVIAEVIGGTMIEASVIDDYPGLPEISGSDLANKFIEHVKKYKVPIIRDYVVNVIKHGEKFMVQTRSGTEYYSKAVILAIGLKRRKLGVPGESKFLGRGVSYCVTCDIPLFKDKRIAIVGGGNAALTGALHASQIASKVYLIHRRSEFRALPIYVELIKKNPKIELVLNAIVKEIGGRDRVEYVLIEKKDEKKLMKLPVDGIFIEIGFEPPTQFLKKIGLETDETGRAIVKPGQRTSIDGLFIAGDCAGGPYKYRLEQVITAAAEGAIAADAVFKYLMKMEIEK